MKKFLKKNLAVIIFIAILLVAGSILGVAIYKVANRVEPEVIIKDNIVLSYAGSAEKVEIVESVESIAASAFEGKTSVKKVSFTGNSKLQSIGPRAFKECLSLTDIVLPKGLKTIGAHAFDNCSSLENIVIPEGVTTIEDYAFYGCRNLKSISLPKSLESLGENVFSSCSSLETITCKSDEYDFTNGILFNKDHTVLYKYLASNSSKSYKVPETVVEIKPNAFQGAKALEEITIGVNVKKIGAEILSECSNLKNVTVPFLGATSDVKDASKFGYFFDSLPKTLETVEVLGGEIISNRAFADSSIIVIKVSEGITEIGEGAFLNCNKLEYVVLPSTIRAIATGAFSGCKKCTIEIHQAEREFSEGWNPDGAQVEFIEK